MWIRVVRTCAGILHVYINVFKIISFRKVNERILYPLSTPCGLFKQHYYITLINFLLICGYSDILKPSS